MSRICSALAKSTGAPCKKSALRGSKYCVFHIEKLPIIYGAFVSALFGIILGYLLSSVWPSQDLKELRQLRIDVQPLISLAESRFPNFERSRALEELSKEVSDLRNTFNAMKNFGELARVNFYGEISV